MKYKCPVCDNLVEFEKKPSKRSKLFPFCSQQCKLIDLGAWFDGEYRLPSQPDQDESDESLSLFS